MTKKKISKRKPNSQLWLWLGGAVVVVLLVVALFWFAGANATRRAAPVNPSELGASLPTTDTAFNVGTLIGRPASGFTLPDANGKPYTVQPGDGKKYVLAFNMGFS